MKKRRKSELKGEETDWESRLERFLSSHLAIRASQGLNDKICVAVHVEGKSFYFHRKKGENTLGRVERVRPDVHFWVPTTTLRHLLSLSELKDTGIATLGVAIFEHIFTKDETKKIKIRIDTGFLGLWAKGYFSVLKAGGPEVASYLANFGFNGLGAIKEVLKNIRS